MVTPRFHTRRPCTIPCSILGSRPGSLFAADLDLLDGSGAPGSDGVKESISVGFCFDGVGASFTP